MDKVGDLPIPQRKNISAHTEKTNIVESTLPVKIQLSNKRDLLTHLEGIQRVDA